MSESLFGKEMNIPKRKFKFRIEYTTDIEQYFRKGDDTRISFAFESDGWKEAEKEADALLAELVGKRFHLFKQVAQSLTYNEEGEDA